MKRAAGNRVTITHFHRFLRFSSDETSRLVRRVLKGESARGWSVGVIFVPDTRMRALNAEYKGRRRTTDVLAFLYDGKEGEVVISLDQARRQAPQFNASYSEEVARLVIHGVLHLLGYGDATVKDRKNMTTRENTYLGSRYARTRR